MGFTFEVAAFLLSQRLYVNLEDRILDFNFPEFSCFLKVLESIFHLIITEEKGDQGYHESFV